jgi:hypothetical protein
MKKFKENLMYILYLITIYIFLIVSYHIIFALT